MFQDPLKTMDVLGQIQMVMAYWIKMINVQIFLAQKKMMDVLMLTPTVTEFQTKTTSAQKHLAQRQTEVVQK